MKLRNFYNGVTNSKVYSDRNLRNLQVERKENKDETWKFIKLVKSIEN